MGSVFLAGVFLNADAARAGNTPLAERLRKRTLTVGVLSGAIVFAGLCRVLHDASTLSHGLLRAGFPVLILAAIAGVTTLILLYLRNYSVARCFAVAAVSAVVTGWGLGQFPWILVDRLTIDDAGRARTTLTVLLVVVALAVVFVLPALIFLLRVTRSAPTIMTNIAPNHSEPMRLPVSSSRSPRVSSPCPSTVAVRTLTVSEATKR